ncbi:hypothetical protein [Bradyrhizobium sp. SZCCHNR1093]|nr:hypothetical protein [Bradyrhizobium sp. SZCCHNR1093]
MNSDKAQDIFFFQKQHAPSHCVVRPAVEAAREWRYEEASRGLGEYLF